MQIIQLKGNSSLDSKCRVQILNNKRPKRVIFNPIRRDNILNPRRTMSMEERGRHQYNKMKKRETQYLASSSREPISKLSKYIWCLKRKDDTCSVSPSSVLSDVQDKETTVVLRSFLHKDSL